MSLVGTRPPTVDEWDKYELHHRARLATKPGLTGMWQVSGRSNITDLIWPYLYLIIAIPLINLFSAHRWGPHKVAKFLVITTSVDTLVKAFMSFYESKTGVLLWPNLVYGEMGYRNGLYRINPSALSILVIPLSFWLISKSKRRKKTSDDKDKFIGEIKWYLKLPADVEYVRPRIFDYSTSYVNPYVSMEYYAYHTVHELFLYGDLTLQQWIDIFNRIRFVCDDFKRYTVQDANIRQALEEMYLTKTLQRFEKMKKDERFLAFFESPITVNGKKYQPLEKIIVALETIIPEMLYDVDTFNIIHGDLCFANIMVDSNFSFIKVIDPRGKFGTYDIYGDFRYELAKLFHSVDGKYDFIIKDLFDLDYNIETSCINYRIQDRKREFNLYKVFLDTFAAEIGNNLRKVELIEALLFLSMIPLHGESIRHQMVMLGTGLEILNRVVNIQVEGEE